MPENIYTSGRYLEQNPHWHAQDSPWKAGQILKMLRRNDLRPRTICEVGCGAGEVLCALQSLLCEADDIAPTPDRQPFFEGYDISPQAIALCQAKANEQLRFHQGDFLSLGGERYDLILLIDLIEHLEDYFAFLRGIKTRAEHKVLHIPLDLSVQTLLRPGVLLGNRRRLGHIHYFTRELALQMLQEVDYEVLDSFYTAWSIELPGGTMKSRLARLPRRLLWSVSEHWAARLMGGFSLMVLAR